jgi:integrase
VARKDGIVLGYYETKKAAEEALCALTGRKLKPSYDYTFRDVYECWSPDHFRDVGDKGREQYENSYRVFEELHGRRFRDLRSDDFQRILDRRAETLSASTVAKDKQLLTQMSEWARKNEIVTTNFAEFCKARGRAGKHHEPMTAEEIAKIQADGSEAARVVCMLLATGCRINELFRLPLEDYHGTYIVGGSKSEAGKGRVIPIRPEGREHFEYFAKKAGAAGGTRLIDGYGGNRTLRNFRRRDYYDLLDRLGISRSKTPHSTRTTYATRAVAEGLSPANAQKVLGHADFQTTQKYYNRPDADALVEAVEKASTQPTR